MKPMSPVIPGLESHEVKIAESQDQYQTLPALPVDGGQYLVTRWRLTWRERVQLLFEGTFYLSVWTFGQPLQPLLPDVYPPDLKFQGDE